LLAAINLFAGIARLIPIQARGELDLSANPANYFVGESQ
jgi:hypothetical protein